MKTLIKLAYGLLLSSCSALCLSGDFTTVYLVRHSEKNLTIKQDPPLTQSGLERAESWAKVFSEIQLDAVYSTDTQRTRDTAQPTANKQGLKTTLYSPADLTRSSLLSAHQGKSILIVGHSNTTPALVNSLVKKEQFIDMDEATDFSSLFIVTMSEDSANAQRLHMPIATTKPLTDR